MTVSAQIEVPLTDKQVNPQEANVDNPSDLPVSRDVIIQQTAGRHFDREREEVLKDNIQMLHNIRLKQSKMRY